MSAGWSTDTDPIREAIDTLADQLGRSVAIDDPLVRQIYVSRHFDDADPVRIRAMLQRDAGTDAITHILNQHVETWPRPSRLTGAPAIGLLPRWCAPLRAGGQFLGMLMVIDAHTDLTAPERDAIEDTAAVVATHLSAQALAADTTRAAREHLLLGLLSADPTERARALAALSDQDTGQHALPHLARATGNDTAFLVTVAEVADSPDATDSPATTQVAGARHSSAQIELALRGVQGGIEHSPRVPTASAVTGRRAVFAHRWNTPPTTEHLREHASRITEDTRRALGTGTRCDIGISAPTATVEDMHHARRQADVALRAARRLPHLAGIGLWTELGAYAPLLCIGDVPPGSPAARALAAIRAHDAGPRLLETLRVYLDHAGSAPRAAQALHLHRTSLYYRLTQIQDLTGMNLDSGPDRLALHLQLHLDQITANTDNTAATEP